MKFELRVEGEEDGVNVTALNAATPDLTARHSPDEERKEHSAAEVLCCRRRGAQEAMRSGRLYGRVDRTDWTPRSSMSLEHTTDLGEGIFHFRSPQWETNCLVGIKDDTAVVVDPAWTREEVLRIRRAAEGAGGPIHFLLTHADVDHTCGMFAFPDATVYAEPVSKELVLNGGAKSQLDTQGPDWGMEFETDLRVDEVVEPGTTLELGPFVVETHEAHGHIMDGLAYVFVNEGVLVPGDYLSASMCPVVWSSVTDFIDTTERLCAVLESSDLRWVVPGHGPLHCPADAIEIGRADVAFLRQIRDAAASAKDDALPWAHAMVRVLAVDTPRPSSLDIEIYAPHVLIAKRALMELGIHKPGEEPAEWG